MTPASPERPRVDARWRPEWRRAVRAVRALIAHPDSTFYALEVSDALDRDRLEGLRERMLSSDDGCELYARRPQLVQALTDRDALLRLPEGSLGRAYLEHIESNGLDAGKIVELRHAHDSRWEAHDEGMRWLLDRYSLCHDVAHVLTGYRPDAYGEAALLWFSHGQTRMRSTALLMLGAGLRCWRAAGWLAWPRYLWRAWRRGRAARLIEALPIESLLECPLDEVRALASVELPSRAHPRGVMFGDLSAPPGRIATA